MKRATLRIKGAALSLVLSLVLCAGTSSTQVPAAEEDTREAAPRDVAALLRRLADGGQLSPEEAGTLNNAVISVESGTGNGDVELPPAENGAERRIYILKMESRAEQTKELLELQRNLLRNQLMVLRVLGVIGMHQESMGKRLSRTENLNRELLSGMQDTGRGVEMARTDISSTLAETTDISEMTEELMVEVEEMQEQLEDIDTGISGIQDTADEILQTTDGIAAGMQ